MSLTSGQDANVRASRYFIVRSCVHCPQCATENILVALLVPPQHEVRWGDAKDEETAPPMQWEAVPCSALLFHIETLPPAVQCRLREHSATFRAGSHAASPLACWANHCGNCNRAWPDEDCFCEPGGAFLPASVEALEKLRLIEIEEPLDAAVGGYAPDPDFLAAASSR